MSFKEDKDFISHNVPPFLWKSEGFDGTNKDKPKPIKGSGIGQNAKKLFQ
jgi:hypothetical protein